MAQRIKHEDCRLLIIGDSNALKTSSHVLGGAICRTWQPDHFTGLVSPGYTSSNDGLRIGSSMTGLVSFPRRMADIPSGDPEVWSNGQDGFIPNRAWDLVADGTGLAAAAAYCSAELTRLNEYPGGDWAAGVPLRTRLIFAHDQSGFSALRYRALRGTADGAYVTFAPHDAAPRPWIDWVDADVPSGSGTVRTQVRTPLGWSNHADGGLPCPDNCTPGQTLFHVGQLVYRPDVAGLQVDAISEAGFTLGDHLPPADHYDDDALRGYLNATRQPNLFLVLVGQNMGVDELNDIEGLWHDRLEQLLERYRSAALSLDPDADPLFVLVSPWSTSDASDRFERMAHVLSNLAGARADTGFINLMLLAGSHRHNDGTLLIDGIHCGTDAAANTMAALLWSQIDRELTGKPDTVLHVGGPMLSDIDIQTEMVLHVAPGTHEGTLVVLDNQVRVRGWDNLSSAIAATPTSTAIEARGGAVVEASRLHLTGGGGVADGDGLREGGAIFAHDAVLVLEQVNIDGGSTDNGGSIALRQSTLHAEACTMLNAAATMTGGVLDSESSMVELVNCTLSGGVAGNSGGAAHFQSSGAALQACSIQANSAFIGGGLSVWKDSTVALLDTTVCSNAPDDIDGPWTDLGGNQVGSACICPADLTQDGVVDVDDLLLVLSNFGTDHDDGDVDNDGDTDVDDLLWVIQEFGPCK